MQDKKKISWFVGHMKKSTEILKTKTKDIDFIIEVVDARLPLTSSNDELIKIFYNKPIIKIALKKDLIQKKDFLTNFNYFSIKDHKDKHKIIDLIKKSLKIKIKNLNKKGILNPILIGMVVGIPNIGKSSLINFLANKKIVKVENRPGLTKKIENVKITNNIFLFDTPGIFIKNVENYYDGLSLALINSVNRDIVDKKDLANHLFEIIKKENKIIDLKVFFKLQEYDFENFDHFINLLVNKRNIKIHMQNSLNLAYEIFINEFFDKNNVFLNLENF